MAHGHEYAGTGNPFRFNQTTVSSGSGQRDELIDDHVLDSYHDEVKLARRQWHAFSRDRSRANNLRPNYEKILLLLENTVPVDFLQADMQGVWETMQTGGALNLLRKLVVDQQTLLRQVDTNVRMVSSVDVDPDISEFERAVRTRIIAENEEMINQLLHEELADAGFDVQVDRAILDATKYAAGAIKVEVDMEADTKASQEVADALDRHLMGRATKRDYEILQENSGRISISYVPIQNVILDAGATRMDDATRVHFVKRLGRSELAARYPQKAEEIMLAGNEVRQNSMPSAPQTGNFVDVVETYERCPVPLEVKRGRKATTVTDYVVVRTVMAEEALLLESDVITRTGRKLPWNVFIKELGQDERGQTIEQSGRRKINIQTVKGLTQLPVVLFVPYESDTNPYGHSLVLEMAMLNKIYSTLLAHLLEHSRKSLRGEKIFFAKSEFAGGELQRIQAFIDDPFSEFFAVEGSNVDGESMDINKAVKVSQALQSQPPQFLVSVMQYILGEFERLGGLPSQAELLRARSGKGKAAATANADRAKIPALRNLAESMRVSYERAHEAFRVLYADRKKATIRGLRGGARTVRISQSVTRKIPRVDAFTGQIIRDEVGTPGNEDGVVFSEITVIENDVLMPMRAESDGGDDLSRDPFERTQMVATWGQMGLLEPETSRDLILPRKIRDRDNAERQRREMLERQQQHVAAMQALQSQEQDNSTLNTLINSMGGGEAASAVTQPGVMPFDNPPRLDSDFNELLEAERTRAGFTQ